ncbi:MAG: hypothetical protein ACJ71W_22075 [Terriglobales bacterium]
MKVELDSHTGVLTIDGLMIQLDLLKVLANPDPSKLYRMRREGEVTIVETVVLPGVQPAPEPCTSVFQVTAQEKIACKLQDKDHTTAHMGVLYGMTIYWTDDLVQCDDGFLRDGSMPEPRN